MKTIYARLGDLQLGDTLEDGTTVGQIGAALGKVGVNIQTANGDLRNMGDVIEELMGKWDQLNTAEQQALAVKLAGKYQYNNLIALLDNAEMYNEQLSAAENSLGTINEQQSIYMESLEGKLNSLQSAFEGFLGSIFNTDEIKPAIDDITGLIKLLTSFTDSVGSTGLFAGIIGTGTRLFSKNIADTVGSMVQNRQARRQKIDDSNAGKNLLRNIGEDPSKFQENSATFRAAKMLGSRTNIMNDDQLKRSQTILKQMAAQENEILDKRKQSQLVIDKLNAAYRMVDSTAEAVKITEDGQVENLEKAKATIENMKTAFEEIDGSSKGLQLNLEKILPGLDRALDSLAKAASLENRQVAGGIITQGKRQAMSALSIFNTKGIFGDPNDPDVAKYQQMFGSMQSFTDLQKSFSDTSTYIQKLNDGNKSSDWSEKYQQRLLDTREKLIAFVQELREMGDVSSDTVQHIEKMIAALNQEEAGFEQTAVAAKDMTKELDFKNVAMSVASLAGDLAQIYSVLSSIKSLGSVIADDSLEGGEKFQQIIENLAFTLPIGLSSISSMTAEIGNLKDSLGKISSTFKTAREAAAGASVAAGGFKTTLKGIAAVVKANPWLFAITLGFGVLSTIFGKVGYDEQQKENEEEKLQETLNNYDELKNKIESVQDAQLKVQEQYDIYKRTGVLTDDLANAVQNYADSLEVPLSKQDLWNEKIDKTIENLNHAAAVQAGGMAQEAIDAASAAETVLRDSQSQKNKNSKDFSFTSEDSEYGYQYYSDEVENYLSMDESARAGFEKYLNKLGLNSKNNFELLQGVASLAQALSSGKSFKELGIDLTESQGAGIVSAVGIDSLPSIIDPSVWGADEARTLKYHVEQGVKDKNPSIENVDDLNFYKDKETGKFEIALVDGGNIVDAINQAQAIVSAGADAFRSLAGVSSKSTGSDKSAYWNYGEIESSARSFLDSEEARAYKQTQQDSANYSILASILQMQDNGEEISFDKILEETTNYFADKPELINLLTSDVIGAIVSNIAANRNIEITDEDKKKLTVVQESAQENSAAYADEIARQNYNSSRQRLIGDKTGGGTILVNGKEVFEEVTGTEGVTTLDGLNSFFEMVGATTREAQQKWMDWLNKLDDLDSTGFDNIVAFYQYLIDHGVDPALAESVVQGIDKVAIFGDKSELNRIGTTAIQDQQRSDAQEKAVQQYQEINRFSTKTDEELAEEANQAFQAEWEYLQSLVSRGIITIDEAQDAFMQAVDEGAGKLIDGTSKVNENLEEAARGTINLKNASDDATKAFEAVQDQVYADLEQRGYNGVAATASNFSNRIQGNIGEEGLIGVYQAIGAGVFDSIVDADNFIQSAIEANIPPELIVQWIQEKIQEGVNVDISAEYNGEMDDELFARQKTEREAGAQKDEYQDFYNAQLDKYNKQYNGSAKAAELAMGDVNSLDTFLDQYGLKLQDLAEMGINYANMTLDEIQQAVEDHYSGLTDFAEGVGLENGWTKDQSEEIFDYATELGYSGETLELLASEAKEAGLSADEFKNKLANLKEGLDSASEYAIDFYTSLRALGYGEEEAKTLVGRYSPDTIDSMAGLNLFSTDNRNNLSSLLGVVGDNEEAMMTILPLLDEDSLTEQINQLNYDPPTFYLLAEIENKKDLVQTVQDAIDSGSEIDASSLNQLYDLAPTLKSISLYSQQGKEALNDLQQSLNDMELQALQHQYSVMIDIDKDSFKSADEYNAYLEDLTNLQRQIDIKIQMNTDQALEDLSDLNAQIEDTKSKLEENDGLVNTDDYLEMIKIWPELSEGATIYANDTMQVSQEAVEAWKQSSSDMLDATIQEKQQELLAQAEYYEAIGNANTIAAGQYANMLNDGITDTQTAKEQEATIEDNLTTALAAAGEEQVDNAALANEVQDSNFLNLANNVAGYYGVMAMDAASSADSQINSINAIGAAAELVFNSVATLVSNALKGQTGSVAKSGSSGGSSYSSAGASGGSGYNHQTTSSSGSALDNISKEELTDEITGKWEQAINEANSAFDKAAYLRAAAEAIGSYNAPGSAPSKGSGGSGSGSGSGYDPKTKDAIEDEADRYEKVNAQIDKLANNLEQLNTEEERLVGFNRSDMIVKETENMQRQIEVYQEKLKLQQQERDEIKDILKEYGVAFDDEGYIENYQQKFTEYLNTINNLIAQYNAATTEEAQNALEEQINAAQEAFDDYKDYIEKYDELNSNSIKETEKSIQDLHDKIEDLMLDIFNKAVDAADSIKDVNDKWADFLKATDKRDSDDPILNMEIASKKIANYFDSGTEAANKFYDTAIKRYEELQAKATDPKQKAAYQTLIDNMKAGKAAQGKGSLEAGGSGFLDMILQNAELLIKNVDQYNKTGKSDMFGENQAGMLEAMETVYDQATQAVIDLRSAIDDLQDKIIDAIDNMSDTIEEMDNGFENIYNKLDHMSNMYAYAYGDKAYDKQAEIYAKQLDVQQRQLENSLVSRDKLQGVVNSLKEGSKERKEAEEKLQEQEDKIAEQTENIAETASNLLNAQANYSVNKWVNSLFGFDGTDAMGTDLDWYATQWELVNKNADYYLDAVNKAYNIQKLQSQYVDLLDNTSALSTQQKITEQMNQQLDYLRDKTNLSEYDVAYAQAQLEILKQQIALEEAQANKSQMKLRRDSQGNYNYVYTANQDDVKSAQDGLLDAQNNAYNLSKDQMRQTQEDSLSAIQQAKQTLIDIWTDANLTVDQKKERMTFIIDNLKKYLQSTGEQMSESESNIINDFYGMVEALTDANAEGLTDIYDEMKAGSLDAFSEIDGHWGNLMTNVVGYIGNMKDFGADLVSEMEKTVNDYVEKIESAAEKSGVNLKNIESNFDGINDAVEKLEDSCKSLQGTLTKVATAIGTMGNSLQQYQDQILSITSENSRLGQVIEGLKAQIEQLQMESQAGATESAATGGVNSGKGNGSSGNGSGSGNGGSGSGGDGVPKVGDLATLVWGDYYYDSWGETPNDNVNLGIENGVRIDWRSSSKYGGVNSQTGDFDVHIQGSGLNGSIPYDDLGWVKLSQLKGYDTGGYTGDWSDGSGKLALLHSKEIVLNAADTENILKAVESVRAMTSAMKGVSLAEAVGSIGSIGRSIESSLGTVDQNVNITAEFPNATSADEIKEALLGLNNQVLHYAHRKV